MQLQRNHCRGRASTTYRCVPGRKLRVDPMQPVPHQLDLFTFYTFCCCHHHRRGRRSTILNAVLIVYVKYRNWYLNTPPGWRRAHAADNGTPRKVNLKSRAKDPRASVCLSCAVLSLLECDLRIFFNAPVTPFEYILDFCCCCWSHCRRYCCYQYVSPSIHSDTGLTKTIIKNRPLYLSWSVNIFASLN